MVRIMYINPLKESQVKIVDCLIFSEDKKNLFVKDLSNNKYVLIPKNKIIRRREIKLCKVGQ